MTKLKIVILLLLTTNLTFGQKTDTRLNGLDTEIENLLKAYNAVGLSIAVVENSKTIYGSVQSHSPLPVHSRKLVGRMIFFDSG